MTKQEAEILEATKEFAEIHGIPYDNRIESMILNAMRESVKNCSTPDVVGQSEQLCDLDGKIVLVKFKVTKHIPKIVIEDI